MYPKELEEIAQKHNISMLCLNPTYKTSMTTRSYNINKMLGYFRRKFLKGDIPTILSNDCTSTRMYEFLGFNSISPTFNTSIPNYEDFLKLCSDPLNYFGKELTNYHLARTFVNRQYRPRLDNATAFNLGDIEVLFVYDNPTHAKERWDNQKTSINPDRFVYLLSGRYGTIPHHVVKAFMKLNGEKLILLPSPNYYGNVLRDCPVTEWNQIYDLGRALENSFDLLGWINGEF